MLRPVAGPERDPPPPGCWERLSADASSGGRKARNFYRRGCEGESARIYAGDERAKARTGRVDFEDMPALTVELLESDAEAAVVVRSQKTWISVDEY